MRLKELFFLCWLFFLSHPAFAAGKGVVLLHPQKPIILSSNAKQVTINMVSNPTTGYSWYLKDYDERLFIPFSHTYFSPTAKKIGKAGAESFVFNVQRKASKVKRLSQLTFIYLRPWNGDIAQTVTFTILSTPNTD
jgi:inhibitor of cysteine peptidase